MKEKRPDKASCNECGKECTHDNDFIWVEQAPNYGGGFWYPKCRYCRAVTSRRAKQGLI